MIPAMTTGMMHFIIRSGRRTPIAAIPTPDLDVPYDAPMPGVSFRPSRPSGSAGWVGGGMQGRVSARARVAPCSPLGQLGQDKGKRTDR